MSALTCPYCEHEKELDFDGVDYDEYRIEQYECDKCGKNFVFKTIIHVDFEHLPEKAPCLNDEAPHKWRKSHYFTLWECTVCGETTKVDPLA